MRTSFHNSSILLVLILVSLSLSAQKKYEKYLDKADAKYEYGDYKKALKYLVKFEAKIKGLGKENKYTPILNIRQARFYMASGLLTGFKHSLDMAESSSASVNGENSEQHLQMLLEISDVYIIFSPVCIQIG